MQFRNNLKIVNIVKPEDYILKQLEDSINLIRSLETQSKTIIAVAEEMVKAFRRGNKALLFGNGGSAADAQHIACELQGKFYQKREPLAALALTTNTSILTAIANDYSFEEVFVRQVKALVKKGDIAIGLSTSGNSPNVLRALSEAKNLGAITIGLDRQGRKAEKYSGLCPLCAFRGDPSNSGSSYYHGPYYLLSGGGRPLWK